MTFIFDAIEIGYVFSNELKIELIEMKVNFFIQTNPQLALLKLLG